MRITPCCFFLQITSNAEQDHVCCLVFLYRSVGKKSSERLKTKKQSQVAVVAVTNRQLTLNQLQEY